MRAARATPRRFGVWLAWLGWALMVALSAVGCGRDGEQAAGGSGGSGSAKKVRIAVIPKGTSHEFWKAIHAGAVKASRELDVEVLWQGPPTEADLKRQIDLVQTFTAQGVSGIVLAPLNDKGLVRVVEGATRRHIPVVVIDSALQGKHHTSFVATDNQAAGRLGAKRMVELLEGKGNVMVLRYLEGSASTSNREKGFLDEIRKHDGIEVLSDNRYGGATTESAFSASESLLLAQKAAEGGVGGVFCPNESTTFGMLLALRKLKLAGKLRFIGFDASDKLVAALEKGDLDALVLQDPFSMGYLGVKTMVSHLRGEKVEAVIDTGSHLVDAKNMKSPTMQRLLKPDLKQWLGR